jgi:putative two-component system response regulator
MKTVYVVDDSDTNLQKIEDTLKGLFRVFTLPSAKSMFRMLQKIMPDIILLDIEMPEMNGLEALRLLKLSSLYRDVPVIFLTSNEDSSIEALGFELGAVDFITKPFSVPVLLNRIKTHMDIDGLIRERTAQIQRLQNNILSVMSDMLESRDELTGGHTEHTAAYVRILLDAMWERGVYAEEMKNWDFDILVSSVRLHDIGKIRVRDDILRKPGKLTREEFEVMKTHAAEGERIIDRIISRTPANEDAFLLYAKMIAGYHHERWDGNGYPYGLKGEGIPLQGRIMAIADVYDALVSVRSYKDAFSDEVASDIIIADSGKHFDPKIVEVFCGIKDRFKSMKEGGH